MVGRYHITGVLGEGGMGVVYEARDPELDRRLAIKLLRDDTQTARLVREARALAQLQHPNVVAIHDVGEHDGCPFLAMELVDGGTLRKWLDERPRTWREIAGVFEQAARGLAAAHAAGLVHRDFKPDNVMIGRDGRVRVTDFGLVRPSGDATPSHARSEALLATQSGAQLGTPAYMSPEQHLGEPGDARSDQFNFMVTLYEAVYRVRPFKGGTWAELGAAVIDGEPLPPPSSARVPRWLRRMIDRGLARDPAERHPSMTAVADQLARGLARRRAQLLAAVAGAALAAGATTFVLAGHHAPLCDDGAAQLAGVWDTSAKQRVQAAFAATGRPFAADAARAVASALDGYAARWGAAHVAACEATAVRHEQSPELLDLRMACLATRRAELAELVQLLGHADAALVERAGDAAARLTGLDECANGEALRARTPVPAPLRPRVEQLAATLATARAHERAGRWREALAIAEPVAAEATRLGYRPLEAQAVFDLAQLREDAGALADAERLYRDAIRAAEAGGHDVLKARAWAGLIDLVGERLARPREALELEPQARATIERVRDEHLRAQLDEATGRALERAGDYPAALARHRTALATLERTLGRDALEVAQALDGIAQLDLATGAYKDALATTRRALAIRRGQLGGAHPSVAKSLENVANAQFLAGDPPGALATIREAAALVRAAYGDEHVETATVRNNLGSILDRLGHSDEALVEIEAALALRRRLLGAKHADVATSLLALGDIYRARGDLARAEALFRECLTMREEVLGPAHPDIELAAGNLGAMLAMRGDLDGAERLFRRALAIAEKTRGPDSPGANTHVGNLARIAVDRGKPAEALPLYQRALASDERNLGKDHPALAPHLAGLGGAYIDLKRPADAVPVLERAIALWTKAGIDDASVAEARTLLAEARAGKRR